MSASSKLSAFQVPTTVHWLSGCVDRHKSWWVRLGDLETSTLREKLAGISIDRPVYVAGIARAGTTVLLELLARHGEVATHRYSDFPGQFVPYWWNRGRVDGPGVPRERAHADRLEVTEQSPEAMEEPLWTAFFGHLHSPALCGVLDARAEQPEFERFYREHLQKLLLVRGGARYVAKGNYNLTRFAYLQKQFADARFVAVVRNPRDHLASLIKQHRLFVAGETEYPRALAHMQRVGHFEFGLDRRPINVGTDAALEVQALWDAGEEVRGSARHWASVYGWFADQLESDPKLAEATLVVRYEDLCHDPAAMLDRLAEHCGLPANDAMRRFAAQVSPPGYYAPEFSEADERAIAEETAAVAARFGYNRIGAPLDAASC